MKRSGARGADLGSGARLSATGIAGNATVAWHVTAARNKRNHPSSGTGARNRALFFSARRHPRRDYVISKGTKKETPSHLEIVTTRQNVKQDSPLTPSSLTRQIGNLTVIIFIDFSVEKYLFPFVEERGVKNTFFPIFL